jgi:hypothetical protein
MTREWYWLALWFSLILLLVAARPLSAEEAPAAAAQVPAWVSALTPGATSASATS